MPKATRVHIRERRGTLFYDFMYQGVRCRESTGLRDTPDNRRRCAYEAQKIESEIALGQFDYVARFPEGNQRHHFTARPTGNITFERFALDIWLPHILTKIADSTAKEYYGILTARVFPQLGSLLLKDLHPEHLDQFTNWLKTLQGHDGTLSPRRTNIILIRVRQVLDLAFEREYLDRNPHKWITLQKERLPRVDPLSFEERQLLLAHLPLLRYGIRKMCADFWQQYFIVAFDTGMRPSEQMALRWEPDPHAPERSSYMDFAHKKIVLGQGWVMGRETNRKRQAATVRLTCCPPWKRRYGRLSPIASASGYFRAPTVSGYGSRIPGCACGTRLSVEQACAPGICIRRAIPLPR